MQINIVGSSVCSEWCLWKTYLSGQCHSCLINCLWTPAIYARALIFTQLYAADVLSFCWSPTLPWHRGNLLRGNFASGQLLKRCLTYLMVAQGRALLSHSSEHLSSVAERFERVTHFKQVLFCSLVMQTLKTHLRGLELLVFSAAKFLLWRQDKNCLSRSFHKTLFLRP